MSEDTRCCGSGTCLINAAGKCWCGQQWDGDTLCSPADEKNAPTPAAFEQPAAQPDTNTPQ